MAEFQNTIRNCPNSSNIKGNETILEQMKNKICKICLKGESNGGIGFLCKIPFPNKYKLPVFITNCHDINLNHIKEKKEIEIEINNKIINIENKYIFTNENYDITIIEIEENKENENHFLELDDNILYESILNYIGKPIYILHYPNYLEVGKAILSYGTIKNQLKDKKYNFMSYFCTENGSSGSPILNLSNNKVIGIHKQKEDKNYNIGTFLNNVLIEFIYKYNLTQTKIENNLDYSIKNNIIENQINEIRIKYKLGNEKKLRIFGYNFVYNNKKNCTIIINGIEKELTEMLEIGDELKNKYILEIKLKGIKNISNMSYIFAHCSSLISLPDISKWNTENIIDMSYLFYHCSSLMHLPDISNWNTKNVINMCGIFFNCSSLLSIPDISTWNTSKVNDMKCLFYQCSSLTSLPDISKWDTKNVTSMRCMLYLCSSLSHIPDISKWNTGNVIDMSYMFCDCHSLIKLPDISVWNTSNVNKMNGLFYNCSSLTTMPDISLWNLIKVMNISCIFYGCINLVNINPKFKN